MKYLYNYFLLLVLASLSLPLFAQNGPVCSNFTNKNFRNSGLGGGSNTVNGVYAVGNKVYAASTPEYVGGVLVGGGLSISTDGGTSFTNKTTANGLGSNTVNGVYAVGNTIYAATAAGLSISTDGGLTFNNRTNANSGLGNDYVNGVYVVGNTIYAATDGGLSISTDGGLTFNNRANANSGLGNDYVRGVYVVGNTIYAATYGGLSISTNGGLTFTNYTTTNGLGSNNVSGVYAVGNTIYAATKHYVVGGVVVGGGLSISTDGGLTFTNKTTANGLGSNTVNGVYTVGNTIYAATIVGLSISTDGGITFAAYLNGYVHGVYVDVTTSKIYAATSSGLSFCQDAALPVSLLYFKGKAIQTAEGYASELTWATASEVNAKSYTIERSRDLQTFTILSSQPAAGNSTEQLAYNYTDSQPHFGTNYYRLSQTDFDGSVHRYQPVAVIIEDREMPFGVFPNPVSGSRFKVKVEATDETQLSLFNELGQKIAIETTKLSETVVEIQAKTDLPSGSYIVKVQGLVGERSYKLGIRN
jgi:hypothetical protein